MRIVRVVFSNPQGSRATGQKYEYLVPDDARGDETHAVVLAGAGGDGKLLVVRIVEWRTSDEQIYEGELKPVVTVFDMKWHDRVTENKLISAALEARIDRKLKMGNKLRKLEELHREHGDEETKELLDQARKYL